MMAMTTNNSISVKVGREAGDLFSKTRRKDGDNQINDPSRSWKGTAKLSRKFMGTRC
jgi:hypothetical protein